MTRGSLGHILLLSVFPALGWSQTSADSDYPFLHNVQLRVRATRIPSSQMFCYEYSLRNDRDNHGAICAIEIDISRSPQSSVFDTSGLRFCSGLVERLFRRHYPRLADSTIPVSASRLPSSDWDASPADNLTMSIGQDTLFLLPGDTVSGIQLMSKAPPGIRKFTAVPEFDVHRLLPNLEDFADTIGSDQLDSAIVRGDSVRQAIRFHGWTVGPYAPAAVSGAGTILDTLVTYTDRSLAVGWILDLSTATKYTSHFGTARTQLQANDNGGARTTLQSVLHDVDQDSSTTLTSEAYALLRYNTEYLLAHIPEPGLAVKLVSSTGARLTGGTLQYYEGSWKDALSHNDGTFSVNTTLHTVSLRMTYAYGTQTKSNVVVGPDTVVFQTVNAAVRLVNSQSVPIDTGSVQYYTGAWRTFGTTSNGVASKELLPGSYSFRMTYASGSNDKQQDIGPNPSITFQTSAASVQLQNSQGALIDQGTVQYYAGAWRALGTTSGGVATKELLPSTYSFRMTYAFGSTDKQQNIGTNATVTFQTVAATVRLLNSAGSPLDQGTVQYYSGAWRDFGTTANGTVTKELLPRSYPFRMTHAFVSTDKTQDLSSSPTVSFSTVLCTVRVKNAQGQPVNNALTSYYAGAWRQIGSTVNGEVTKELLPVNLTFRASSGGTSQDKAQSLSTNPVVEFVLQP
jgi:hypothetical protein